MYQIDKIDKEQINRATAINTDFEISGKKTSAEDLGFSTDKDKATGAKRREKIYFSINDMANPDLAFSQLFGHEKAHMNTYDEGKDGEETSIHTREKIGSENKNKVFTEEEKAEYLNNLRNKYKDQKSIEDQFAEAKLVPEKDKEHIVPALIVGGAALIYRYGPEITEAAVKYGPLFLSMMLDPPEINKEDEIDNLDDIKNYKSRVIPNKENKILDNDEETAYKGKYQKWKEIK